jgi:predicted PurR-regulated permease PerM
MKVLASRGVDMPERAKEAPELTLRVPVDVRSLSLAVLAVLAVVYTLHWAQAVFVPVMIAVVMSAALSPVVNFMHAARIPRAISAAVVVVFIVGAASGAIYGLSDEAADMANSLPRAMQQLSNTLRREQASAMENVQEAAKQLENVAVEAVSPAPARGVTQVQIVERKFRIENFLWNGTLAAAVVVGQALTVLFLTYFMLATGDVFRHKLASIGGSTLRRRKITLQALDEISLNIQRYLLVLVVTGVLVGVATWLAFLWIGMNNAAIWGIAAGVFNSVPYVGPVLVTAGSTLVGIVQFDSVGTGLLVGSVGLVITTLEGYLLTPWLTGRAGRMNPVVVLMSVVFWGWLWGAWGLILGVPIVMMVKAVCDRIEDLKPIGELLGT